MILKGCVSQVLGLGISIILATGAGLGVLFVRKAVVTSEGKIDEFTAKTVKWALRFVGGILLIQVTLETFLCGLFMASFLLSTSGFLARAQKMKPLPFCF